MEVTNKKKVLIMSMAGGFGHIRAGDALLDYAKEYLPGIHAQHVDIVTIDTSLKKYNLKVYDIVSKKLPFLWEAIYKFPPAFLIIKKVFFVRGLFNDKVKKYIQQKNPDAIIFTNGLALSMFAFDFRKVFPAVKVGVVLTDYHGHSYYRFPFVDFYFVPNQAAGEDFQKMGIEKDKIVITGIPVNPRFYIKENIDDLRAKYCIKNTLPVVLLIASFRISLGNLLSLVAQLLEFEPRIQVIAIANGNQAFYDALKSRFAGHERLLLVHWTNVMEEYMKISDVVISKAGGLTVSECLSLQKPLIILNPIPGQEEHNAAFIAKNHFGAKVKKISEIITILPNIISSAKNNQMVLLEQENPCEKIFKYMLK